ncbi:phosphotransferase [Ferrimonas aestuarii]|uniref:Aminoglycoside phosphotransferase family protein n=1 Tax=Ferrimonas aestuarii TaxID=2569539 RepID=A0A4U1BMT8_9GAMM|nr:phosphotransferase [Ferrimonas aestuarii]TKB52734.1 aminoglycoside phosphotransferase family protein [Ferrimonas aestuarii]
MSAEDYIVNSLNPTKIDSLDGFEYRDKGFSGRIYTNELGHAVKIYNADLPVDAVHFEVEVLKRLQATPLATVKLIEAIQLGSQWGFRYHWIDASPVDKSIKQRVEDRELIARQLARLHTQVHRIPSFEFLPSQQQFFSSSFDRFNHLQSQRRRRLLRQLETMSDPSMLCHGDFNPRNTLMAQRQAYVIDWQRAFSGDPMADVAKTWVKVSFHAYKDGKAEIQDRQALADFMRCYLDEYERLGNLNRELLLSWIEIVAGFLCRSPENNKRQWYSELIDLAENSPKTLYELVFGAS